MDLTAKLICSIIFGFICLYAEFAGCVPFRGKCRNTLECDLEYSICLQKCFCMDEKINNTGVITCAPPFANCSTTKHIGPHLHCADSKLTCDKGYKMSDDKTGYFYICAKSDVKYGGHCSYDQECFRIVGAKCHKSICTCYNGIPLSINSTSYCPANLYGHCLNDDMCFGDKTLCNENNRCECKLGFKPRIRPYPAANPCVEDPSSLVANCTFDKDCKVDNSKCLYGSCFCQDGYNATIVNSTRQCSKSAKPGEKCKPYDKLPTKSKCENGVVKCLPAYKSDADNTGCYLNAGSKLLSSCEVDFQCQMFTNYSYCGSDLNLCECHYDAIHVDNQCLVLKELYNECSAKDSCPSNAECKSGFCKCKSGYSSKFDNGYSCPENAWTSMSTTDKVFLIGGTSFGLIACIVMIIKLCRLWRKQ